MSDDKINNIIVVGASAGGITAVEMLLSTIPKNMDAAIFVVIHLSAGANPNAIRGLIGRHATWPIEIPENGTLIKRGKIYLAPADNHMMIKTGEILIANGAKENHWRPSIDILFRTAAAAYNSCVIGIILSGLLDDGTSGMVAIKSAGGLCIVQEPEEADYADMPNNVINNIDVDYRVSLSDIGYILADIDSREECVPAPTPVKLKKEAEITMRMASSYKQTQALGSSTIFTCPDCGGVLTKIDEEDTPRYRCFTGHVFSERFLEDQYLKKTEETLWVAMRMMEERKNFLASLIRRSGGTASPHNTERKQRTTELETHISRLKELLNKLSIQ
ncbi:chemotaxis protein CheB [Sphingobacterium sp. LRF_L2]|uniref:chemotaxis protein CheB n=1 Tax=Sphingobacterium sp. LRF_L2 TaxID=3369421 RepID=UPI003F6378C5